MTAPFLEIRGIAKSYGEIVAVKDVRLEVERGELMTFLGPSGSGKSTTLYILAGFEDPTKGDILMEGRSLLQTPSHLRNIGMVFQRYTLFPHLSVADNVAFPLRVRRLPKAEVDAKVAAMLKLVRLEQMADRMPAAMSGGQQQRVALARALAYDPPILLMDEPLSALDKKLREELQFEIGRVHNETGVTIPYVTQPQLRRRFTPGRQLLCAQREVQHAHAVRESRRQRGGAHHDVSLCFDAHRAIRTYDG
jgi:putative spermidine/putrescine transport system ATP-binding protein